MADVTIKVTKDDSSKKLDALEAGIERFVKKGIAVLDSRIKAKMAEPKTGQRYGKHIASAPGEAPAIDSSNLIGSIEEIFPSTLEGKLGTVVAYAPMLESGTSRMEARPVWEVTAIEEMPTLEALLKQEVGDAGRLSI